MVYADIFHDNGPNVGSIFDDAEDYETPIEAAESEAIDWMGDNFGED